MVSQQKKHEYEALQRWLAQTDWQVFGTLKLTDGAALPEQPALKQLRTYFNKLDRVIAGQGRIAAGQRIQRAVFKHYGSSGQNLHFHFLARPVSDVVHFCQTARCLWDQAGRFTESYDNTRVEPARSKNAVTNYVLHEHWRLRTDTLITDASHVGACDWQEREVARFKRAIKQNTRNREFLNEPDECADLDQFFVLSAAIAA